MPSTLLQSEDFRSIFDLSSIPTVGGWLKAWPMNMSCPGQFKGTKQKDHELRGETSGEVIHPVGFSLFGELRLMLRPPSSEGSSTWRSAEGRTDGEGESQDLEDSQIRESEVFGSSPTESEVFGESSPTESALFGDNAEDSQIRESEVFGESSPTESDLFGPQLCEDGQNGENAKPTIIDDSQAMTHNFDLMDNVMGTGKGTKKRKADVDPTVFTQDVVKWVDNVPFVQSHVNGKIYSGRSVMEVKGDIHRKVIKCESCTCTFMVCDCLCHVLKNHYASRATGGSLAGSI